MAIKKSTLEKKKLKNEHQANLNELYKIYFEKAKTDVNAFRAFMDFSDRFFADSDENNLMDIVQGVHLDGYEDIEQ